jgi:uncharacterized protein
MSIAFLTLELHIEAAQSIKDRRQVVRSLKDRLRTSFNVSVAELDAAELWNRATIGVVSISNSRDYLDGLMKNVERAATRIANNHGAEIADSFVEYYEDACVETAASAVQARAKPGPLVDEETAERADSSIACYFCTYQYLANPRDNSASGSHT